MNSTEPENGGDAEGPATRRRRRIAIRRRPVTTTSGISFTQSSPTRSAFDLRLSASDQPYNRPGAPADLQAFGSREDAVAAWASRVTADLAPLDAVRVLTGVRRRISCLHVRDLIVADVRHPDVLRQAGLELEQLELMGLEATWRIAEMLKRIPGIGGLKVPPLTPGASEALVIFRSFLGDHVELVHSPIQVVTPAFPSGGSPERPPVESTPGAVVIDLDRLRPAPGKRHRGQASS